METFMNRHEKDIVGILNGFDRMRFRGTLRSISYADGFDRFLGAVGVRYKDFGSYVQGLSEQLKDHARQVATRAGRPLEYLASSRQEKEAVAKAIAERDGITEGLVCVLSCVEPCMSFCIRRDGSGRFRFEENSIKMYDKQGSILRIETTINNARRFKVRRMTARKGVRRMRWIPMRHGVADLGRRVQISRAANERYLEALAVVEVPCPASELLDAVDRRLIKHKRPYRALHPVSRRDTALFRVVLSGQFLLKGFTNRHLRQALGLDSVSNPHQRRRESARMTRLIRLLRAHRLIRKLSHTRYYRVTARGQRIMTAALKLRDADVVRLTA